MVLEDIRNVGGLGVPEEYFIPWDSSKNKDWEMYIENIKKNAATSNGVYSVKVMANQLPVIDKCLIGTKYDKSNGVRGVYPRFKEAFSDCKFLMLKRDSIVRQAISRELARQTGINHATKNSDDQHFAGNLMLGYDESYNRRSSYQVDRLSREVVKIAAENSVWEHFFDSHGIKSPLVLRYEEICKNFPGYLGRIARFLGVEISEDTIFEERKMVKLSNNINDDWFDCFIHDILGDG